MIPRIVAFLEYDPEPEPRNLPQRIAYARRRLGYTQEDLAPALNISLVTLWRWETGRLPAPQAKLQTLHQLLNLAGIRDINLL